MRHTELEEFGKKGGNYLTKLKFAVAAQQQKKESYTAAEIGK